MNDDDPLLGFTRGDVAKAKILRDSLRTLRENSQDPAFRKLMDDVLAGRATLRQATGTQVFDREVTPLVMKTAERMEELSEEDMERLAAEGEAVEAEINARYEGRGR
ncbi:hypothetical protein [Actinocorallia populi]|uniref:hypothetical protein n=1 Tax=Actinocorallia populi TaxID=2079200 RepID=UPI000D08D1A3|nr:hypothetical protein [Actinocorallia populi]